MPGNPTSFLKRKYYSNGINEPLALSKEHFVEKHRLAELVNKLERAIRNGIATNVMIVRIDPGYFFNAKYEEERQWFDGFEWWKRD